MCTIGEECRELVGFSAVNFADLCYIHAVAEPGRGSTFSQQVEDALRIIADVFQVAGRASIVHQAVFIDGRERIGQCRRLMRDFYGRRLPATSYIPQPPCSGNLLSIQAFGVGPVSAGLEIEHISEQLAVVRHGGMAWTYCTPLVASPRADSAYIDSAHALDRIKSLLGETGARVDQIIRTWFYLGGIVAKEDFTPRYKEFNRAREDFYEPIQFLANRVPKNQKRPIYPASTCIGAEGRDLTACAIALSTERNDVVAVPLENPRQTAAYKYGAGHGLGSPKFSRAMALSCGSSAMIFVSGTASITDAETRHIGDAIAQTHETLTNIEALISEDNLRRHGLLGLGTSLRDFGAARVYVKRQEDYGIVREICQKRMGDIPTIYTTADVCRRELLVEIEGIVYSKKSANRSDKTCVPRPHFLPHSTDFSNL